MNESDSEDAETIFNKFIEVDGEDNENENKIVKPKTKKEQINKIIEFVNDHNEDLVDKIVLNDLWNNLTMELNDLGPPIRSKTEWKRVWSVYKYNKNKKRKCDFSMPILLLDDGNTSRQSRSNLSSHSQPAVETSDSDSNFHSNILEKLGDIAENQKVMIKQQKSIIQQLDETNNLLKENSKNA